MGGYNILDVFMGNKICKPNTIDFQQTLHIEREESVLSTWIQCVIVMLWAEDDI